MPQIAIDSNGNKVRYDAQKRQWIPVEIAEDGKGNSLFFDGEKWSPNRKPLEMPKRPGILSIVGDTLGATAKDIGKGAAYDARQVGGAVEGVARAVAGAAGFIPGLAATLGSKTFGGKNWQEAGQVGGKVVGAMTGGANRLLPESRFYEEALSAPFALPSKAAEAMAQGDPETQAMLEAASGVLMLAFPYLKGKKKAEIKARQMRGENLTPGEVGAIVESTPELPAEVKARAADVLGRKNYRDKLKAMSKTSGRQPGEIKTWADEYGAQEPPMSLGTPGTKEIAKATAEPVPPSPAMPISGAVPKVAEITKAEAKGAGVKWVGDSKAKLVNGKEQRYWLEKKVDEAIKKAPDEARQKGKREETVLFDVPGDGQFEITNSRDTLELFKKKLSGWPSASLKPQRGMKASLKPMSPANLAALLEPGESMNLGGRGSYFIAEDAGSGKMVPRAVFGDPVDVIPGFEFFAHKWASGRWKVSETTSGLMAGEGSTKAKAIESALERINKIGVKKASDIIKNSPKLSSLETKGISPDELAPTPAPRTKTGPVVRGEKKPRTAAEFREQTESLGKPGPLAQKNIDEWAKNKVENDIAKQFFEEEGIPIEETLSKLRAETPEAPTPLTPSPLGQPGAGGMSLGGQLAPAELAKKQLTGEVMGIVSPLPDVVPEAQKLYSRIVNQYAPIERLSKGAEVAGRPIGENPKHLVRSWLGEPEKIGSMLDNGIHTVNPDGTFTKLGEGLKPILREYSETSPIKDFKAQEADLDAYLIATRTTEDLIRPKNAGATENIVTPAQVAKAQADLGNLRAKYGNSFPLLENTARRIYKFQSDVLDYLVDRGLYSQDEIDMMRQRNPHYIPFDRVVEAGESSGLIPKQGDRFSKAGSSIKRIKGSEREINPVIGSAVRNTYRLIDAADRNYIASAVSKLADIYPDVIKIEKTKNVPVAIDSQGKTIFRPSQYPQTPTSIQFKLNGKAASMQVTPELYKAMMNMNPEHTGWLINVLSYPKRWLQMGATITPEFIFRNPMRDQYSALQQTKIGFRPYLDPARAIADIVGHSELYNEYLMSGSPHAGIVSLNRDSLAKAYKQFVKDPSWASRLNIVKDLQQASELMEKATRFGVYERARKAGKSPLEAGTISAESTVDFRIQGSDTKFFTKTIPFLNAGIQGIDRFARAYKTDPVGMTAKGIATITIPSIILHEINKDNPNYKELPNWDRNLFWHIPVGNRFIRIPKPFIPGQLFGTSVERFLDYAQGRDPKALKKVIGSLAEAVSPAAGDFASGIIPASVKPLIENIADWSFFRQAPIVPESKKNLPPEEQYGGYTSEVAKGIGKRFGTSPAKVDNVIFGYFGGMGRYATQGADALLKATGAVKAENKPQTPSDISDLPILRAFLTKPEYSLGQQSIRDFYENKKQAEAWRGAFTNANKSGKGERVREIVLSHPEQSLAADFGRYSRDFTDMRREMDKVSASKTLSDREKKVKMTEIARAMTEKARRINAEFNRRRKGAK